ncbi:MAG: hypothetical protein OEW12_10770, partial [Deltaproteobacteria bacterium]|nr:hypothetical protein [Deltaproteobacteria bacterium]
MIPLGVLVLSSAAIGVFGLDLLVSGWFYRGFQDQSWPVGESPFWRWFYVWGEIPAVAVFSGGVFSAAWGLTRLGAKAAARGWAWRGGLLVAVA